MNSLKYLLFFSIIFFLTIAPQSLNAQSKEIRSDSVLSLKKGDIKLLPVPIFGANPTVGFLYGVAVSGNAMLGDPKNTRMSTSISTLNYSTNKQLLMFIKTNIYTPGDKWILLGDWRYFDSSQPTFGLGTGPQSSKLVSTGFEYPDGMFSEPISTDQMLEFNYIKLSEIALKKVKKSVYVGLGYHFDYHYNIKDNLLKLDTIGGPARITSHYAYSKAHNFDPETYTLSGFSLNFVYDSRDNAANPYHGRYALASCRINPEFIGSSQNSTSLWLEYRDYFGVSKKRERDLIGIWLWSDFEISGKRPYMDLGAIGWDQFGKSGRGYTQGRFRGNNIIYSEVEYRAHLWGTEKSPELIGAVVFANATTASNMDANINLFKYVNYAYGIGLRLMVQKPTRINVTIDYAWGQYGAQGLFINANEVF